MPETLKFRKRVSDEQIKSAAVAIYATKEAWYDSDKYGDPTFPDWDELSKDGKDVCLLLAKAALEAVADVIEGELQLFADFYHVPFVQVIKRGCVVCNFDYETLEQFHAEWEQI